MKIKILLFILFSVTLINLVNAQYIIDMDTNRPVNVDSQGYNFETINGNIRETGKIIGYHAGHFVTNVKGEFLIENRGNNDLYSINIPFTRKNDLYLIETSNTGFLLNNSINIPMLLAGQSTKIEYQFIGLTLKEPDSSDINILNTAIEKDKIRMYSDVQMNLKKGPLENQSGDWRRLISINIKNPSRFLIEAIDIKITKTDPGILDINNNTRIWNLKDTLLIPRTMLVADILDYTEEISEVYWISADTSVASYNMTAENFISYLTEKDISNQDEKELEEAIISQQIYTDMPFENKLILKKFISKNQIKPNETITIKNMIYNFEDVTKTVNLEDFIPENFIISNITNETRNPVNIINETLNWENIKINPGSARIFSYDITLTNENVTGIQYIKGSRLNFGFGSISTENIPIILQYLPEKKLFIQKKIKVLNDEQFLVEIIIENVGQTNIENIILRDNVPEEFSFSEITKNFLKRGVWEIKNINSQDSWTVSYVTNNKNTIQEIPLIFGIEQNQAYITLTVESLIKTRFSNQMQLTEKIGIFLTIIVAIGYILIATKKK